MMNYKNCFNKLGLSITIGICMSGSILYSANNQNTIQNNSINNNYNTVPQETYNNTNTQYSLGNNADNMITNEQNMLPMDNNNEFGNILEEEHKRNIQARGIDIMKMSIEDLKNYLDSYKPSNIAFDTEAFTADCPIACEILQSNQNNTSHIPALRKFLTSNYSVNQIEELINKLLKENIIVYCKYNIDVNDSENVKTKAYTNLFNSAWKVILQYIVLTRIDNNLFKKCKEIVINFLPNIGIMKESQEDYFFNFTETILLNFIKEYTECLSNKNRRQVLKKILQYILDREKTSFQIKW